MDVKAACQSITILDRCGSDYSRGGTNWSMWLSP